MHACEPDDFSAKDMDRVVAWMHAERIRYTGVIQTGRDVLLTSGDTVLTPAVLLIDRNGRLETGISHPQRVANTRPYSFAEELGLL